LERELRGSIPELTRGDSPNITTFGAPDHAKFVFAYPTNRKSKVTMYFIGNLDIPVPIVTGMPILRTRPKFANPRTKLTPYFTVLESQEQVGPFAKFLILYSVPLAQSKRRTGASHYTEFKLAEEVPDTKYWEGHSSRVLVNRYERDVEARKACIRLHGPICCACGLNFETIYGEIAKNYIHVHHLEPVSQKRKKYTVDPQRDLVPLCPNCHAVAHLRTPPFTPAELRNLLDLNRQ